MLQFDGRSTNLYVSMIKSLIGVLIPMDRLCKIVDFLCRWHWLYEIEGTIQAKYKNNNLQRQQALITTWVKSVYECATSLANVNVFIIIIYGML